MKARKVSIVVVVVVGGGALLEAEAAVETVYTLHTLLCAHTHTHYNGFSPLLPPSASHAKRAKTGNTNGLISGSEKEVCVFVLCCFVVAWPTLCQGSCCSQN